MLRCRVASAEFYGNTLRMPVIMVETLFFIMFTSPTSSGEFYKLATSSPHRHSSLPPGLHKVLPIVISWLTPVLVFLSAPPLSSLIHGGEFKGGKFLVTLT